MASKDHAQRLLALDPEQSFIVQAPAGSGKTELLTQRYLKLLSMVDRPERVLAITFTRKATQEMRERIVLRLRQAASGEVPDEKHEQAAVASAIEVLEKDRKLDWNLLRNPARLQIQTIDGLCARIASMIPAPGAGVSGLRVLEDARPLYDKAARRMIEFLGSGNDTQFAHQALTRLLVHLQGDAMQLQSLISEMLGRRDQWLALLNDAHANSAHVLQKRRMVELDCLSDALGHTQLMHLMTALLPLTEGAEDTEAAEQLRHAIEAFQESPEDAALQTMAMYRSLDAVATQAGTPFAPGSTNSKVLVEGGEPDRASHVEAIKEILGEWKDSDIAKSVFTRFVKYPPLGLDEEQAKILQDCVALLQIADVELRQLFAEQGQADFQYLAQMAMAALGSEEQPGDVLLYEDYRLSHILMDEFQDTSHIQFKLLKRLISGWQPGDGRSLFLVGDPMQSIYRFRKADVSLFKQVFAQQALGDIPLQALQLSSNFRSRTEIIDWVNTQFGYVFKQEIAVSPGAVAYSRVDAERKTGGQVVAHSWPDALGDQHEAALVAELIAQKLAEHQGISIAVLARGRKHLVAIAQELKEQDIVYEAVNVEGLSSRPVIQDLLAILRAILHPADRIAWLALLRAPWAALTAAELHLFAGQGGREDILATMLDTAQMAELGEDASARVNDLGEVMLDAIQARCRKPLHRLVEAVWIRLKGPLIIGSQPELDNAQGFFSLLADVESERPEDILETLVNRMENFYSGSMASPVQLMTIHGAKGLQFDVVILPGLHKRGGRGGTDFLRIEELQFDDGSDGVLMAPIKGKDDDDPGLYGYLGKLNSEQEEFESQRVLYVAATRAKQELHVFGGWKMMGPANNRAPGCTKNTFMKMLWPVFEQVIDPEDDLDLPEAKSQEPLLMPYLKLENPPAAAFNPEKPELHPYDRELRIPDRDALALGDAVHLWLELIHDHGPDEWSNDWLDKRKKALQASLVNAGARPESIPGLCERLQQTLSNVMSDDIGQGIVLQGDKQASWVELAFYTRNGKHLQKKIIDRIYQKDDGSYVIIDYKTGQDSEENREKWKDQLDDYKKLVETFTGEEVSELKIFQVENGRTVKF